MPRRPVLAALLLFAGLTWCGPALGGDLAERRERIEGMPAAEKHELLQVYERFTSLDPAEQERLRPLHEEVERQPDAEELREVADRYYQWLKNLPPDVRADLKDLPPAERIEKIKELRQEEAQRAAERARYTSSSRSERFRSALKWAAQRDPGFRVLASEDPDKLYRWVEEVAPNCQARFLETLPEKLRDHRIKDLANIKDPKKKREMLGTMWLRWQMQHPGELPVTEEELAQLRSVVSDEARQQLDSMSETEQRQLIARAIGLLVLQEFGVRRGGPPMQAVSEEELAQFFETGLSPEDRARLLSLPVDEMRRELWFRYLRSKMPGVPFFHPDMGGPRQGFGPGRGFGSRDGGPGGDGPGGRRSGGGFGSGGRGGSGPPDGDRRGSQRPDRPEGPPPDERPRGEGPPRDEPPREPE